MFNVRGLSKFRMLGLFNKIELTCNFKLLFFSCSNCSIFFEYTLYTLKPRQRLGIGLLHSGQESGRHHSRRPMEGISNEGCSL